jgi:hypothetical protein
MDRPKIYDQQGQERDWTWLIANFGAVKLERAEVAAGVDQVYRIVMIKDAEGPAVTVVNVTDPDGKPLENVRVVRYWPDAPSLPGWPPPASRWRDRGVYGGTNINGDIGFGMGRGDYFFPPSGGASALWVSDERGPSDFIEGLGMLGGTNHRHLNIYFQLQGVEAEPPEPPEPPAPPEPPTPPEPPAPPTPPAPEEQENWDKLFERVDRIIELLEGMSS